MNEIRTPPGLPAATALGPVRLRVADLDGVAGFYRRAIGLHDLPPADGALRLGALDGTPLVELVGDPAASARPPRSTGLFHLAILLPSRADLAQAVHRVTGAGWGFSGAADHLVSEALYLNDPEGNGIEIYRDRPRDQWAHRDGELEMGTLAIDLDGVLGALPAGTPDEGVPDGTVMGHVHLQVHDVGAAEAFYNGVLGFDVMVRGYPGALFVAAGGYHHHLGLNTWSSRGGAAPPAGSRGLDRYRIHLPARADVDAVAGRLATAGHEAVADGDGLVVRDPSGNAVMIATAP
ncbi:MAG: VOC family protein [Thermoleophilia bacterium]|nr:VOC family protein [Thermoleophilia bacterium]